jgi:hypothetical protein
MRGFVIVAVSLAMVSPSVVASSVEDFSLHFSTNTPITWKAPTNHLPKRFWTYKRCPQVFSAAAISNGIVLAGFEEKGFPRPSTNHIVMWADHMEGEPRPPNFAIFPEWGQMSYDLGDRASGSPLDMARDDAAVKRALKCVSQLGVDLKELVRTNAAGSGTGGVFLPRQIDGIQFFDGTEGFQIMFGKDGKIRGFSLQWPALQRDESSVVASPQETIRCIRAYKTLLVPADEEGNYLLQVKDVARARRLTITQVTPYYGEGVFGEEPRENEPSRHVRPIAILGAKADFGTNAAFVRLYAPILASDVRRLLGSRAKRRTRMSSTTSPPRPPTRRQCPRCGTCSAASRSPARRSRSAATFPTRKGDRMPLPLWAGRKVGA